MIFSTPEYGILFIALALASYLLWRLWRWRKQALRAFADEHMIPQLFRGGRGKCLKFRSVCLLLALFFMIIALMAPQWGEEEQKLKREGLDIVFALDLSNSMNAEDIAPSRIDKAKKFINSFLSQLGGDRVGLVIFAGEAYAVSPLTTDYTSLHSSVSALETDLIWNQGTNLSAAIDKSLQILGKNPETSKAIILISDGEDHEEGISQAIKKAKAQHTQIFTMGIGGESPVPIPMYDSYGAMEYKLDDEGNTVLSRFEGEELRKIAEKSNGAYIKIGAVNQSVKELKDALSNLDKKSLAEVSSRNKKQQFQYFVALALLFLFIYTLTPIELKKD
ncbi:VWA domain-containing protein [Ornithobacterium rhinotracheale]|uniref:VWA domain-containing protein n=1 Tax=Ornithobacterium rhinotracheale TaxID=28251 RepID=A0A3R5Y206_ORNRH|nr:VWA domain-containing protein [Ornithobacterium rhinotracheale]QAR29889.1 VWA domain-containing protein [Ornithobacterium rhinotracheale]